MRWTAPSGRTYTTTDALTARGIDYDIDGDIGIGIGNASNSDHHSGHPSGRDAGDPHGSDPPTDSSEPEPPARFPDIPPF